MEGRMEGEGATPKPAAMAGISGHKAKRKLFQLGTHPCPYILLWMQEWVPVDAQLHSAALAGPPG